MLFRSQDGASADRREHAADPDRRRDPVPERGEEGSCRGAAHGVTPEVESKY